MHVRQQQPTRKKRGLLLRAAAVVLCIAAVLALVASFWFFGGADQRAVVARFLDDVRAGDLEAAAESTGRDLPTNLEAYVAERASEIAESEGAWLIYVSRENDLACVLAWLRGPDLDEAFVYVVLEQQRGRGWKVIYLSKDRPAECVWIGTDRPR